MTNYNVEAAAFDLLGNPVSRKGSELNYFNPLGNDGANPDFWLNLKSGAYNSFSSSDKGHFTELYARKKGLDTKAAFMELVQKYPTNGAAPKAIEEKRDVDFGFIYRKMAIGKGEKIALLKSLATRKIHEDFLNKVISDNGIKAELSPKFGNHIVVPISVDLSGSIVGIQKIPLTWKGDKKIHGSLKRKGPGHWIVRENWLLENKAPGTIFVVESVVNALTLGQIGFQSFCAFSATNAQFQPDHFQSYEKIILCRDNDKAGMEWAVNFARSVGPDKCLVFQWPQETPGKWDVNDQLKKDSQNFATWFSTQLKHTKPAAELLGNNDKESVRGPKAKTASNPKINIDEILSRLDLPNYLTVPNAGLYKYASAGYWQKIEKEYLEAEIEQFLLKPTRHAIGEIAYMAGLKTLIPESKKLNDEKWVLNLRNGLMDIQTGKLHPHRRDLFSTIQLPIEFDPSAMCPAWEKFLKEAVEDSALIKLLQEFVGLCLVPETKFQKALILVGSGANGKSTFLSILEFLLGRENISTVPMGKLESEFHRAALYNKLANISSELEISELMGSGYFKSIVGGDLVDAAFKFKDSFNFKPFARLLFAMNELPRVRDKSFGFFRRLLIVPFNRQFTGAQADKTLPKSLMTEINGIFNWALSGLKRLFDQDGFTASNVIDEMVEKYKKENNPIISFVEDRCKAAPGLSIIKANLYENYKNFCAENGYKPLNNVHFFRELKNHVPQISEAKTEVEGRRERVLQGIMSR